MKIFITVDAPDFDDVMAPMQAAMSSWVAQSSYNAQVLCDEDDDTLGLTIETGKKATLKSALDFLYDLAKAHELDFAVGFIEAETGTAHKVCYFGYEEGRPDIAEIGSYLGLKR